MSGRPKLKNKGIVICLLRDRDNLSLSQMGEMFGLTNSAVSRYIERYWKEYVKMKRSGAIDIMGKGEYNKK